MFGQNQHSTVTHGPGYQDDPFLLNESVCPRVDSPIPSTLFTPATDDVDMDVDMDASAPDPHCHPQSSPLLSPKTIPQQHQSSRHAPPSRLANVMISSPSQSNDLSTRIPTPIYGHFSTSASPASPHANGSSNGSGGIPGTQSGQSTPTRHHARTGHYNIALYPQHQPDRRMPSPISEDFTDSPSMYVSSPSRTMDAMLSDLDMGNMGDSSGQGQGHDLQGPPITNPRTRANGRHFSSAPRPNLGLNISRNPNISMGTEYLDDDMATSPASPGTSTLQNRENLFASAMGAALQVGGANLGINASRSGSLSGSRRRSDAISLSGSPGPGSAERPRSGHDWRSSASGSGNRVGTPERGRLGNGVDAMEDERRASTFSMGFRADCSKCRDRVPGHFAHIS